ncbi:hypothetical protein [Sphingomonas asaccharolytica]|uniref:hypothetical protein n=1 Tax=Sphingomonas asaccharolytica TaxID=40681 RepID=UPI0012EEAB39|nr:hypothetical protein [Sphingomonas asaccharolytica]
MFALAIALLIFSSGIAHAQPLTPPKFMTLSPTGVELLTGVYTMSSTDLSIGSLTLERSYLGSDRPGSGAGMSSAYFGNSWTHNFDIWARNNFYNGQESADVVIGRSPYKFSAFAAHNPYPDGASSGTTLTEVAGAMIFTDRDGTVYRFLPTVNGFARISTVTHPDGTILTFSYVSNLPKTIVSNRGYALVFDYSSSRITTACGFNLAVTYVTTATTCSSATLKTSYGYTGSNLTSVTDVSNNVAHYSYNSDNYLICPTDPGTTTCKYTITISPNAWMTRVTVTKQVAADGAEWNFVCSCGDEAAADPDNLSTEEYSTMTEPNGATSSMWFSHSGYPSYYQNENGKEYTPFYASGVPLSITSPEGNQTNFSYNPALIESKRTFVAKPGSGLANIEQSSKTFPTSCTNPIICNLPLTVTDARGAVTTYTYDSTHGGVLTETKPADSAGINAVVRHSYAQKYAYIKNSGGGYSPAATPVWVLAEDRTCRTTATVGGACAGGSSDEVVTTYDYGPASGPNNLLLRGVAATADGVTRRTCFGYDWMGNKISETKPRAGLAVCS